MTVRSIRHLHPAVSDDIGDLRTQRPLPNGRLEQIDPFLFLNHHGPQVYGRNNRGLPFGPHPHRGFETVTFIVEGSLAHRDSAGHESVIRDGGVQWMTAGRGVVHAELSPEEFLRDGGPLEILQLWVNLPARLKMTAPRYIGLQADEIPAATAADGVRVSVIAGTWDGTRGPVETLTDITMTTIAMDAGSRVSLPAPHGENVFFYVVRGELRASTTTLPAMQLVEFNDDGDTIEVEATQDSRILFGHATPFGERVVAHGPFVMNSHEEIYQAMLDYQMGRFA
ncbi:MAG: pirin family protein [Acidobacteria bacterium]|nr:pirin family protein [Acidobacteriota bacterium]MBV9476956.1 pirin family protein [Acidobacteriota bacterium]